MLQEPYSENYIDLINEQFQFRDSSYYCATLREAKEKILYNTDSENMRKRT